MGIQYRPLASHRMEIDPRIWFRYHPLTKDEMEHFHSRAVDDAEFLERIEEAIKRGADASEFAEEEQQREEEAQAMGRDLLAHIRELWLNGTCYKDSEDIIDWLCSIPAAQREATRAIRTASTTSEADAPFSGRGSTGR